MKKILLGTTVLVIVVAMAGGAFAATATTNVAVTATVKKTCANAVGGTIGGGTPIVIDPSAGTTIYTGTDATLQCTKNYPIVSITASSLHGTYTALAPYTCQGAGTYSAGGFQLSDGVNSINYNFACNVNITGLGFTGAGINVPLGTSIQIPQTDAAGAIAGVANYTDTVTLTITF